MADSKVSDLTAASALTGVETFPAVQSGTSKKATVDQVTTYIGGRDIENAAITTPAAAFAADTYVVGSSCAIPDTKLQAKSKYFFHCRVSKTAAGTATPILTVRYGTLGTTSDTTGTLTFTFAAGTAAVDSGVFDIWVTFNSVGSATSAVMEGTCELRKNTITAAGLVGTAVANITLEVTSAGFNSTTASSIIGVSINGGTSAAWTVSNVQAKLDNLA